MSAKLTPLLTPSLASLANFRVHSAGLNPIFLHFFMPAEIELKLQLAPAHANAVFTHTLLAAWPTKGFSLRNTYYDTPDKALKKRGVAVRLRYKSTGTWLLTVKASSAAKTSQAARWQKHTQNQQNPQNQASELSALGALNGSLAERDEWEYPIALPLLSAAPAQLSSAPVDFSPIDDRALRDFLEHHLAELNAVFSCDFARTTWLYSLNNQVVEIALDQGTIHAQDAGNAQEALCEIELELIKGSSPQILFDLAAILATDLPVRPEIFSKAERGFWLAQGKTPPPVEQDLPNLAPNLAPDLALHLRPFEIWHAACVSQINALQRNENGVLAGCPEYLTAYQNSLTRLCTALSLCAPLLANDPSDYVSTWQTLNAQITSLAAAQELIRCAAYSKLLLELLAALHTRQARH